MPNIESVRVLRFLFREAPEVDMYLFHPACWCGQFAGNPDLVEVDGATKCAECRCRLDYE